MSKDTEHSHPLEDIFNIDSGSTPVFVEKDTRSVSTDLIDPKSGVPIERKVDNLTSDDIAREDRLDDLAVDRQLATIHDAALTAFEQQSRMAQEVDPKFAARNAEVAAQYLNIALNATNSRVDAKYKRGKLRIAANQAGTPQTLNQNVFIADRNAILRQMMEAETQDAPVIEGAIKEVK
jgi:hypothetical protein